MHKWAESWWDFVSASFSWLWWWSDAEEDWIRCDGEQETLMVVPLTSLILGFKLISSLYLLSENYQQKRIDELIWWASSCVNGANGTSYKCDFLIKFWSSKCVSIKMTSFSRTNTAQNIQQTWCNDKSLWNCNGRFWWERWPESIVQINELWWLHDVLSLSMWESHK